MYDTIRFVINVSEGWRGVRLHDGRAWTAACLPQVCTTLLGLLLMFPKAGGEYAYMMAVLGVRDACLPQVCTTLLGLLLMFPKAGGEYAYTMAVLDRCLPSSSMYDTIRFVINVSEGWRGVRLHDGRWPCFPKAGGDRCARTLPSSSMYDTIRFVINVSEGWRGVRLHDGRAWTAACLPQVCTTLLGLLLMFPKAGGEYAYMMAVLGPLPAFLKYVRHY